MKDLDELLSPYAQNHGRSGVLLDTNILLLLVASQFEPSTVGSSRLAKYTRRDAELLASVVGRFRRIWTTVHILTETSNLARQLFRGAQRTELFHLLYPKFFMQTPDGFSLLKVRSSWIAEREFVALGFTDAALAAITGRGRLLLTDDLSLHLTACARGAASLNFTHLREAAGLI